NIPATPFTLNGNSYTTNLKINLTSTDAYTYDFSPAFYSPNKNAYYTLTSIDFCGKTTSSNPNTFIMSEEMNNCTIEATYSIDYLVTFTVYNGSISLSPLGICTGSATSTESCYYPAGTTVTMTDTANSGYVFNNYTGIGNGSYSGTSNPTTIIVNGHITEYANNDKIKYLVTFTVYNGSITISPLGTLCSGSESSTESCYYTNGTQITVSDTPNSGYVFNNYTGTGNGSYSGTDNPATIIVNGAITEYANNDKMESYQQLIQINEKNYPGLSYSSSTANFYFEYNNGTHIPGLIISNNSGILSIFVKLNNIKATSITIKLITDGTANLLSNSGTSGIGEASQLSPVCGEYDDGQSVFPIYGNFYCGFDGWTYESLGSTYYSPTFISAIHAIQLINGLQEGTVLLPPNNNNIQKTPLLIEASFQQNEYQSSGEVGDGSNMGVFGNQNSWQAIRTGGLGGDNVVGAGASYVMQEPYTDQNPYPIDTQTFTAGVQPNANSADGPSNYESGYYYMYLIATQSFTKGGWLRSASSNFGINALGDFSLVPSNQNATYSAGTSFTNATFSFGSGSYDLYMDQYIYWVIGRTYSPTGIYPTINIVYN
ncbi:MAG: hypothetical protein QXL51_07580, partial [Candidatus Aenigmatarchaeota archaeon]